VARVSWDAGPTATANGPGRTGMSTKSAPHGILFPGRVW
jgi:hypothetical protein